MVLTLCAIESQDLLPVRVPVKLTFADMEPEVMKFNPRATIIEAVRLYEQRWETSPKSSVQLMWVEGKRYLTSHETWGTRCRRGLPTIEGMLFSRHPIHGLCRRQGYTIRDRGQIRLHHPRGHQPRGGGEQTGKARRLR